MATVISAQRGGLPRGSVRRAQGSSLPPVCGACTAVCVRQLCGQSPLCSTWNPVLRTHTDTQYTHVTHIHVHTHTPHTHTHTHAHTRLSFVSFRGTAAGGMGYWRSRFPYGEQGCTNWAILFVFVSFLRGCRSPCKRCNFSMKWLLKGSDAATSQKVEFCLKLGLAPYREAIFPKFRIMRLLIIP